MLRVAGLARSTVGLLENSELFTLTEGGGRGGEVGGGGGGGGGGGPVPSPPVPLNKKGGRQDQGVGSKHFPNALNVTVRIRPVTSAP